ncbi:MAG: beta-galactosidase [Chthoniobacterales bacterium]
MNQTITLRLLLLLICFLGCEAEKLSAATWRVEAEKAGPGSIEKMLPEQRVSPTWAVEKVTDASEGAILSGTINEESNPISVAIPQAGRYHVWVRHYHTAGKFTSFYALFRDNIGQAIDFHNFDFKTKVGTAKPGPKEPDADKNAKPQWVWNSFDITFERPMEATLSFGPSRGLVGGKVGIDCVVITDDKNFDPAKIDVAKIGSDPGAMQTQTVPAGMKPSPVITANSSFFAGESDPDKQYSFGFLNAMATYRDYAWAVQMGGNFDHGWTSGSRKYGIGTEVLASYGYMDKEVGLKFPAPLGRFVNSDGKMGKHFSYSYEPFRKGYMELMTKQLQNFKDDNDARTFMVCDEGGGYYDYSDAAKAGFHSWLTQRFVSIDKLNSLWNSNYKSFDDIPLPQKPKDGENSNRASWFAFREFSGLEYANFVAAKAKVIRDHDSKHRHSASQASCLEINAPVFTLGSPMDFEDMVNVGFANEPDFGVDAYSTADSFVGCDMDFLLSLTKGRRFINSEFNVHSQDARNMSQAYWAMIGKGVKGAATWCFQETPHLWMYYMWALLNSDDTPRDKLGPIADGNQEVHRLERILGPSKPAAFVKPVALYYSRMDLALPQPTMGVYSGSIDSPYRIYAILRGLGYPVRWITPKQIIAGELKDVGAVFMLGANHVPADAATRVAQWVKEGGCLVGDQWPGGFDEYDRTQTALMDVFGIRPAVVAKPMDKTAAKNALEMTTTPVAGGIDPEVMRTLGADELFKRVEEIWDQYDSTHPVAKAARNWHFSGFDFKKVEVVSPTAEVIGMSMGRTNFPAMVINAYGKGNALYSTVMLGSLYEAGPVAFEWDSAREGPGVPHLLNAFLRYSKVEPLSQVGLPERFGWRMRVETPLVDEKGNVFVALTSLNEAPMGAFPLTLRWPLAAPKMLMVLTGGSREMKPLPFELKNGKLKVTMPAFDTAASIVALNNSEPIVSLDISGAPRGVAGLLDVTPNTRLKVKATVWNPSSQKLPAGEVKLFTAPGWFCNEGVLKVAEIEPYGHQKVSFEVEAPALCSKYSIRPIVFKYSAGKVTSTPCTEMVWWNNAKDEVDNQLSVNP